MVSGQASDSDWYGSVLILQASNHPLDQLTTKEWNEKLKSNVWILDEDLGKRQGEEGSIPNEQAAVG